MNRWGKLDYGMASHPRFVGLPRQDLGVAVAAIGWSGEHLTDGLIPEAALPLILADSPESMGRLVARGVWQPADGGYQIHDFPAYNETKAVVEAAREDYHIRAGRSGGLHSVDTRIERYGSAIPLGASNRSKTEAPPKQPISEPPKQNRSIRSRDVDVDVDVDVDKNETSRARETVPSDVPKATVSAMAPSPAPSPRSAQPTSPGGNGHSAPPCPDCGRALKHRVNSKTEEPFLACPDRDCNYTGPDLSALPRVRPTEMLDDLPSPDSMTPEPWKNTGGDELVRRLAAHMAMEPPGPDGLPL